MRFLFRDFSRRHLFAVKSQMDDMADSAVISGMKGAVYEENDKFLEKYKAAEQDTAQLSCSVSDSAAVYHGIYFSLFRKKYGRGIHGTGPFIQLPDCDEY